MKRKRGTALTGAVDVMALGIAGVTLLGFMGRLFWVFDLFSHFRVQYFQVGLVLLFIALWKRWHKRAIALIMLIILNYAFVLPLYFGRADPSTGKPVRAMLMNINAGNGNTDQVLAAIQQFEPDILLLEEVTPAWAAELAELSSSYPYQIAEPQQGCFGILLLSKYPLKNETIVQIGSAGLPSIVTDIQLPSGIISLLGTHPLPPIGARSAALRNQQLAEIPRYVAQQQHPVLLMGDLNLSPWSPHFRKLLHNTGLNNSMNGFGVQPSWPSRMWFMQIPLDHVLYSEGITIHNRMVGGDVGSDHLPVIVDFSVK